VMDRTRQRLQKEATSGASTRGVQVVVTHRGREVLNLACGEDGVGRPMTPETVSRVYCSIKPMVAIAVAAAIQDGLLTLDEPLEAHLPRVIGLSDGVTARHVLTHTAGLHLPTAPQMEVVVPSKRRDLLERMMRQPGWRVGIDAAFSEYTGWIILGWLLEAVSNEPLREYLRATVLDPLNLTDTWIGMTDAEFRAVVPRLGVSHDLCGPKPMPMFLEASPRWCTETNPAHGGYSTAADLARFYGTLLDWRVDTSNGAGDRQGLVHTFTSTHRVPTYDKTLGRVCPWGLGFMTSLGDHKFGEVCSTTTFGHSGYMGASFAFADPDQDVVIAAIHNGIERPQFIASRRIALVRDIYDDLGLVTDATEPVRTTLLPAE
jgi:CubicO group peptidase (beta-lactamase class C family)